MLPLEKLRGSAVVIANVASSIVSELDCAIDRVKLAVRRRDGGGGSEPAGDGIGARPSTSRQEVVVEPLRHAGGRAKGGRAEQLYAIWDKHGKELRLRRCDDARGAGDSVTVLNLAELQRQYDATISQMESFRETLRSMQGVSHRLA